MITTVSVPSINNYVTVTFDHLTELTIFFSCAENF